jgi:hypothetical protein
MALVALKMMVVAFPGLLIHRDATRQLDRTEPAFFNKRFDIAVDGSNAHPVHFFLSQFQDL